MTDLTCPTCGVATMSQRRTRPPGVRRRSLADGTCDACYLRQTRSGQLSTQSRMAKGEALTAALAVLVATPTTQCLEWSGVRDADGYGQHGGRMAHREVYEALVGPVSPGLELDHLCRNRACVNPAHMEPVTHRENTLRGTSPSAINAVKTHCSKGHEYTPENTYVWRNARRCRTCNREIQRRKKAHKREQASR